MSNKGQEEKGGREIKGRILEQHGARRKGEEGRSREESLSNMVQEGNGRMGEHGKNP